MHNISRSPWREGAEQKEGRNLTVFEDAGPHQQRRANAHRGLARQSLDKELKKAESRGNPEKCVDRQKR